MPPSLQRAIAFQREADKLKSVLRQTRVTFDVERRENDAEHSWHLALFAMIVVDHAPAPGVDLLRVLRMLIVHDLVEIDAGDTFLYDDVQQATKAEREQQAANRIFRLLDEPTASELRSAWDEFEARATPDARFARALDRAQPILQNLWTEGASWRAHGVSAADVRARSGAVVREGAPALWEYLDALLDDAVARGLLPAK